MPSSLLFFFKIVWRVVIPVICLIAAIKNDVPFAWHVPISLLGMPWAWSPILGVIRKFLGNFFNFGQWVTLAIVGIVAWPLVDFLRDFAISSFSVRLSFFRWSIDLGPFVREWISFGIVSTYCLLIVPLAIIWIDRKPRTRQEKLEKWAGGKFGEGRRKELVASWVRGPSKWYELDKVGQTVAWSSIWLLANLAMAVAIAATGALGIK